MNITHILFWFLSVVTLFSALMVVISKNPVYSVLWLIVTFFAISAHYIMLNAQFLAIVNIIVYAGAIMVLFLFVIMLMNVSKETEARRNRWIQFAGAISGGCLLLVLVAAVYHADQQTRTALVNGGALTPAIWEWQMAWPIGWTGLTPLETVKFQQWLHAHGGS